MQHFSNHKKELVNGLVRGRLDHHINEQALHLVFVHVIVIVLVNQNDEAYYCRAFFPSHGSYKLLISPFGITADSSLIE